jgi:signal transduction histidine kinase
MELVFRNLIHNAIKFTPEGGDISISSFVTGDLIEVTISDTGVGIPPDQLASLFEEPSIRNTRGTKGERGTGLGLTLCYEMIKTNNGQIRVESKAGGGTTVFVSLKAPITHPVLSK